MLGGAARMDELGPEPRRRREPKPGSEILAAVEKIARNFDPPLDTTIVQMAFEVGLLLQRETAGLALIEIEAARDPRSLFARELPLCRASLAVLVAAHTLLLELAHCEAKVRNLLAAPETH